MNKYLLILIVPILLSCGSKKKLTSIGKEEISVKSEIVNDVESKEVSAYSDTMKGKSNKTETITESMVREILFNKKGVIEKVIERSDKSINIDSFYDFIQVVNEIKEQIKSDKSIVKIDSSAVKKVKDIELIKTPKNPIWNWTGGALFVCILVFFGWKVLLKR